MFTPESMFGGFDTRSDADATRRYSITSAIALVVLGGLASAAIAFSGTPEEKEPEPEVIDVTFQAPAAEEPPPPPVPQAPKPAQKVARNDAPRPARAPDTPTKISEEKLEETDESRFKQDDSGSGGGDMLAGIDYGGAPSGLGSAPPPPPPPKPKAEKKVAKAGPIQMPENATPPKPVAGNAPPDYPEDARASGIEGEVFLKIVINEDGSVGEIEVKKGEEPFVSAAIAAVKAWKYTPALVDGKATAVYRIIKVPFKLKA
jgi:protein TonB